MTVDSRYSSLKTIVPGVSRETNERLIAFEELFRKWSSAINLASPSTLADLWSRHILDSSQIFPLAPDAKRWLDLGSGGGFPGIVTACFLKEVQSASIDLVESAGKKLHFFVQLQAIWLCQHVFILPALKQCGIKSTCRMS